MCYELFFRVSIINDFSSLISVEACLILSLVSFSCLDKLLMVYIDHHHHTTATENIVTSLTIIVYPKIVSGDSLQKKRIPANEAIGNTAAAQNHILICSIVLSLKLIMSRPSGFN